MVLSVLSFWVVVLTLPLPLNSLSVDKSRDRDKHILKTLDEKSKIKFLPQIYETWCLFWSTYNVENGEILFGVIQGHLRSFLLKFEF